MANVQITQRDTQLERQRAGFVALTLTNFGSNDEPQIAAGSVVEISGSVYSVTSNESITGWAGIANGPVWVKLVPSGTDPFTAEYTATAPTWSDAKQGWYDGTGTDRYVAGLTKTGASGYVNKILLQFNSQLQPKTFISGNFVLDFSTLQFAPSAVIYASFASPSDQIRGVAIDPATGNLISCDRSTNRIYIHDGISDVILSDFASPSNNITGITVDPATGNLISCDSNANRIYIHAGISATTTSDFASPANAITGIDVATGNLISCDSLTDKIYIHTGISATVSSDFASPASNIQDVAFDQSTGNLLSCDDGTDRIYIHAGISATVSSDFASPSTEPSALMTGPFISCDKAANRIYRHYSQFLRIG